MSAGGVVQARSLRCAGNAFDEAIVRYVRRRHQLLIGDANAERIKIEAGTATFEPNGRDAEIHIRGRDMRQGRPKSIVLGPKHIAEALEDPIEEIAEFVQRALEDLRPELATDICDHGIHLTGGGSLLNKLDAELERRVGVKFLLPDRPTRCVIDGSAEVLKNQAVWDHLLIKP
jgi:rod shape-determining protein MreB